MFSFSENVLKLSYSNAEFKNFPGDNTPDSVSGEGKVCFRSPNMYQNSPIQQCRIQKFSRGQYPEPSFEGRGKFVFALRKCTKTLLQQCRIQKFSLGQYPGPRFRGEESWLSFSENVPKLSYSNAEFLKKIRG